MSDTVICMSATILFVWVLQFYLYKLCKAIATCYGVVCMCSAKVGAWAIQSYFSISNSNRLIMRENPLFIISIELIIFHLGLTSSVITLTSGFVLNNA